MTSAVPGRKPTEGVIQDVDCLLWAVGREPNSEGLCLDQVVRWQHAPSVLVGGSPGVPRISGLPLGLQSLSQDGVPTWEHCGHQHRCPMCCPIPPGAHVAAVSHGRACRWTPRATWLWMSTRTPPGEGSMPLGMSVGEPSSPQVLRPCLFPAQPLGATPCRGSGSLSLPAVAIAAGRKLAHRLFEGKQDSRLDYENIPTVVFSHPPIGTLTAE